VCAARIGSVAAIVRRHSAFVASLRWHMHEGVGVRKAARAVCNAGQCGPYNRCCCFSCCCCCCWLRLWELWMAPMLQRPHASYSSSTGGGGRFRSGVRTLTPTLSFCLHSRKRLPVCKPICTRVAPRSETSPRRTCYGVHSTVGPIA